MREFIAARFLIATNTFCAVSEETAAAATAEWKRLLAAHEVTEDDIDTTPRLALVDDIESPTCWGYVSEYYRVRHADKRHGDAGAYHVGNDRANIFEEKDASIEAARSLDDLGDDWDMCVVAFDDVTGSGRVVWGS